MKFLLTAINAKYIHSNPAVFSLKAFSSEFQDHIEIAEYTINHYTSYILEDIYKRKPDAIGFSCYIWNMEYVKELIPELKKVLPLTEIWLGGPEVTYRSEEYLELLPMATGIMYGEGEKVFRNVMAHYVEGNPMFTDIKGICYRDSSGNICRNDPEDLLDMSNIPFVYDDLSAFQNRIIYYESSRGCPFACSYCLSSVERSLRFRDTDLVLKDLAFFLKNEVSQVKFVDRTFNCNKEHAMAIWGFIHEHDNGVTNFHFEIAADLLGEAELELFHRMRPGLIQLEIGVQSTNPETIREIDRKMDFTRLAEIVNQIRSMQNIHQHLDLIAGLPYEGIQSFEKSFNDVFALRPDQLQLGFLKVLSGSKMYLNANQYGIVYKDRTPYEVLYSKWLSYDEVLILKGVEEMVEVYYNSGQFRNTLEYFVKFFPSPYELFEKLSQFYENRHMNDKKHSRVNRYEILLDFMKDYKEDEENCYEDLLTYDLYLRENMKTRPSFSRNLAEYKVEIQNIIKRDTISKTAHVEVFGRDMEVLVKTGLDNKETSFLKFDYERRNPLSYDAETLLLKSAQ